jgi:23S rRNA pseudouridine1911/1915/1917 synthase
MVIARNSPAHAKLSAMFKNREIKKTYLALVQGHPDKSGTIDFAIDRDPVHRYMMTHGSGREAVTHYQVLQYFELATLIEAKPVTGRTHQIRVHFAAIGHPILGDETYGTSSPCISRQALHASSLSFTFNNTPFTFTAELPADFQRALSCLNQIDS